MDMVNGLLVMDDGLRRRYLMRLSDVNLCNTYSVAQVQHRHAVGTILVSHSHQRFALSSETGCPIRFAHEQYLEQRTRIIAIDKKTSVIQVWWLV